MFHGFAISLPYSDAPFLFYDFILFLKLGQETCIFTLLIHHVTMKSVLDACKFVIDFLLFQYGCISTEYPLLVHIIFFFSLQENDLKITIGETCLKFLGVYCSLVSVRGCFYFLAELQHYKAFTSLYEYDIEHVENGAFYCNFILKERSKIILPVLSGVWISQDRWYLNRMFRS